MSFIGLTIPGFASPLEGVFAALMLLPLCFFAACALYLLRLLFHAARIRGRVVVLTPPELAQSALAASPDAASFPNSLADASSAEKSARFLLLIPAHDEELLLGDALRALQRMEYPRTRYEIVVIADNCSDATARIARHSGALALERSDKKRIGKGYALEDTLAWLMADAKTAADTRASAQAATVGLPDSVTLRAYENDTSENAVPDAAQAAGWARAREFDAVVILDADTFVSDNLLTAFDRALNAGEMVIQARYDVFNTGDSWRTRLMSCALALAHVVKPLGRERLRLSDGLKGNGMCFARRVVVGVPWSGESITEDIEYTLRVCRAGYRVAFAPETSVWAQMPTTGAQAASQRQRWEGGRYQLLFRVAPRLWKESAQTRNRLLRDRAIELIVPPFAEMFALPVAFGGLCALFALGLHWHVAGLLAGVWALILLMQAVYLLGGMWVARMPARVVLSLFCAPFYIVWKLGLYALMAVGRGSSGWKRTERHELSK